MPTDADIAAALKSDHPDAARHLVDAYGNRLLRSACLLCGNETDAQDIVQDTLITAFKIVGKFRGDSALYTWLHGIMINTVRHFFRARKKHVSLDEVPEQTDPKNHFEGLEQLSTRSVLMQALDGMTPEHREVVVLRFFEELKLPEIAERLGIRVGTVKSRLHYALQQLRGKLPAELNPCAPERHLQVERLQ